MNYSVIIKKIKYLFTKNKNCTDFQNEGKYCLQTDEISKKLTCSGIIIRFKHETARHIHYQQEITALWHIKHIHLQIHLVFNVWRVFQTCDLAFALWHSISSVLSCGHEIWKWFIIFAYLNSQLIINKKIKYSFLLSSRQKAKSPASEVIKMILTKKIIFYCTSYLTSSGFSSCFYTKADAMVKLTFVLSRRVVIEFEAEIKFWSEGKAHISLSFKSCSSCCCSESEWGRGARGRGLDEVRVGGDVAAARPQTVRCCWRRCVWRWSRSSVYTEHRYEQENPC